MCKNHPAWVKPLSLFLALVLLTVPMLAQLAQQEVAEARAKAEEDARRDAKGSTWFILGCVGSALALIAALVIEPTPPQSALLGKSPEYVAAYADEYKSKIKSIRTNNVIYGCLANAGIVGLFYVLIIAAATTTTTSSY